MATDKKQDAAQPEPMQPVQIAVDDVTGTIQLSQRADRFAIKPTTMTVPMATVVLAVAQFMERQAVAALGGPQAIQMQAKTAKGGTPD